MLFAAFPTVPAQTLTVETYAEDIYILELVPDEVTKLMKSLKYNFRRLPTIADIRAETREIRGGHLMPREPVEVIPEVRYDEEEVHAAFTKAMAGYRERHPEIDSQPAWGETTAERVERVRRLTAARLKETGEWDDPYLKVPGTTIKEEEEEAGDEVAPESSEA
jgi:hypothetical protein